MSKKDDKQYGLSVSYDPPLIEKILTKGHSNAARIRHFFSAGRQSFASMILMISVFIIISTSAWVGTFKYGETYSRPDHTKILIQIEDITESVKQSKRKGVVASKYIKDAMDTLSTSLSKNKIPSGFKIIVTDINTVERSRLLGPEGLHDTAFLVPSVSESSGEPELEGYMLFAVTKEVIGQDSKGKDVESLTPFITIFKKEGDEFKSYGVSNFNGKSGSISSEKKWFVPSEMENKANLHLIPYFLFDLITSTDQLNAFKAKGIIEINSTTIK